MTGGQAYIVDEAVALPDVVAVLLAPAEPLLWTESSLLATRVVLVDGVAKAEEEDAAHGKCKCVAHGGEKVTAPEAANLGPNAPLSQSGARTPVAAQSRHVSRWQCTGGKNDQVVIAALGAEVAARRDHQSDRHLHHAAGDRATAGAAAQNGAEHRQENERDGHCHDLRPSRVGGGVIGELGSKPGS